MVGSCNQDIVNNPIMVYKANVSTGQNTSLQTFTNSKTAQCIRFIILQNKNCLCSFTVPYTNPFLQITPLLTRALQCPRASMCLLQCPRAPSRLAPSYQGTSNHASIKRPRPDKMASLFIGQKSRQVTTRSTQSKGILAKQEILNQIPYHRCAERADHPDSCSFCSLTILTRHKKNIPCGLLWSANRNILSQRRQ